MGIFSAFIDSIAAYFSVFSPWDAVLLVFDILIVAVLIYFALVFVRGTKASKIIYGIAILLIIAFLGRLLNLETLNWVLEHLTTVVVVAIPVLFQPELRRALEKLGRTKFVSRSRYITDRVKSRIIRETVEALRILKNNEVGALIVFQRETGLVEYIEDAVTLNAEFSAELLLSIFFPKSPLHDGAVIVSQNKVLAASAILPVSETKKSFTYGTRHRAAVGVSEDSDAFALVVSEERGVVSLVVDGKIKEYDSLQEIEKDLLELL
jgi:diadenylate cyclase